MGKNGNGNGNTAIWIFVIFFFLIIIIGAGCGIGFGCRGRGWERYVKNNITGCVPSEGKVIVSSSIDLADNDFIKDRNGNFITIPKGSTIDSVYLKAVFCNDFKQWMDNFGYYIFGADKQFTSLDEADFYVGQCCEINPKVSPTSPYNGLTGTQLSDGVTVYPNIITTADPGYINWISVQLEAGTNYPEGSLYVEITYTIPPN